MPTRWLKATAAAVVWLALTACSAPVPDKRHDGPSGKPAADAPKGAVTYRLIEPKRTGRGQVAAPPARDPEEPPT